MTEPDAQQRREWIIEAALDYMSAKGWYYEDCEDDPEVIAALERLYADDLQPTPCTGSVLADTGVTLAYLWAQERRAAYERSRPLWVCDCAAVYKRDPWSALNDAFYTVAPDGVFDELVGTRKGKRGIGKLPRDTEYPANNGGCSSCARAFSATTARQADPQTSFLLDGA